MTRSIEKRIRALVVDWGKMLDERTETFNLIIPTSIEEAIDKIAEEVKQESIDASKKAKKVSERLKAGGKLVGRIKLETPPVEELRQRLMKESLSKISKELGISRATIRKRLQEEESMELTIE